MLKKLHNNNGMAAFVAIMMMVMLTMIGVASIKLANDEVTIAGNEMNQTEAFYVAEAGLEQASAALVTSFENTNGPPARLPTGSSIMGDCVMAYNTTSNGALTLKTLSQGSFQGLKAQVQSFTTTATGFSLNDKSQTTLSEEFECALIPIFQFAVFYYEDLWTQPIFDMDVTGRVHVNGNMYLQNTGAGKTLAFHDQVTCAGDINHGFPSGADNTGDVGFYDAGGNYQSMEQDGQWLDATSANWYDSASSRWDGNVRDQAFGQEELSIPLTTGADPHTIIERYNSGANPDSYETKAEFKIIDGVPYSKAGGVWVDVSAPLAGIVISDGSEDFSDRHEKKSVRNTEIDMAALKASGYFPSNGVIYISDQRALGPIQMNGVTLANGTDIGNDGLGMTLVSENPVYIEGDFNTITKQPAAVIADACTFLSNDWEPTNKANSSNPQYTSRPVTGPTEVNISMVTGDLAPSGTNYGGGLENLPRFLEDWDGAEFIYSGSMIEGWRSRQATGTWRYIYDTSPYYSAPTRNWGYDHDLDDPNKMPPETPLVRAFQRVGWREENIEYVTTNR